MEILKGLLDFILNNPKMRTAYWQFAELMAINIAGYFAELNLLVTSIIAVALMRVAKEANKKYSK